MYKLIIVDDESLMLDALKDFIVYEDYGFQLIEDFTSASDAIEYIKNNRVDAIITDICMNDSDGFKLASFCREYYADIQIAFISAYRDFEYARQAMTLGITNYLTKPLTQEDLITTLKKFYSVLSEKNEIIANKFVDTDFRLDCQQLFSDLYCGLINDFNVFANRLSLLNLNIDTEASKVALINLHICDFNNYIAIRCKYETFRLYDAIDSIIPFYTDQFYAFTLVYLKANMEILVISTPNAKNFEQSVSEFASELVLNLANFLYLTTSAYVATTYTSVSQFCNNHSKTIDTEMEINDDVFSNILDYINNNFKSITSVSDVAKYACFSPAYLGSRFKQKTGEGFNIYLNKLKIKEAKKIIKQNSHKMSNIYSEVGYNSPRYFYKMFKQYTGMTPSQYKNSL